MNKIKKNKLFLVTAFINILLFVSVFYLMNHVQKLLNSDAKINLEEIVTQNKDVISSKLRVEVNNLDLISKQIADRLLKEGNIGENTLKSVIMEYADEKKDHWLCIADLEGNAFFSDGQKTNIKGRNYYRLALNGTTNISERVISRLNGQDIFVISVPLVLNGKLSGTVQKQYTPEDMYDICSVSLFSEQGYMYVVNSQGYILISSKQESYSRESDNYYRMLYLINPKEAEKLKKDIQSGQDGFMETEAEDGEKIFSAYTPIEDVYDWYLISSVATNAVSPNSHIVIRLFYFILIAVVLFFGLIILYFFRMRNRQQAILEKIAFVDPVTGGSTYTKFVYDMQILLQENEETDFYLLAFDIDNFKYINSYYGFETGDHILKEIYDQYSGKMLQNERIARVTGDDFVMLLVDAAKQRLDDLFQSEVVIHDIEVYLSAGLYPITNRLDSVNLMFDKASMAARKIKGLHYKTVEVYLEELNQEMTQHEQIKRSVELALAKGEIIPFFQPKVDINNRKLTGAEALARWKKSDGTLVSPGMFIPVCENTGLIVKVDMAILEQTLQFIQMNRKKGVSCVPISVNFSRMHLHNKDFLKTLLHKLEEYQVPPELIELELTETVIYENYQKIQEFIEDLHHYGLQISIDDFGSGYSSLHMLKDVEIDILKIDGGFLRETIHSDRQKAIFAAIAQMAEKLHIKVVVEGVENIENVELMREFGCSVAQGYFYSKPISLEAFSEIFEKGRIV